MPDSDTRGHEEIHPPQCRRQGKNEKVLSLTGSHPWDEHSNYFPQFVKAAFRNGFNEVGAVVKVIKIGTGTKYIFTLFALGNLSRGQDNSTIDDWAARSQFGG